MKYELKLPSERSAQSFEHRFPGFLILFLCCFILLTMARLSYNELRPGTVIVMGNQPMTVLASEFSRMQQRAPVVRLTFKNMISGKVVEYSAQPSEQFEEADVEVKSAVFVYTRRGEYWFHEAEHKAKRFALSEAVLGDTVQFLKPGLEIKAVVFQGEVIMIQLPVKSDYVVQDAPPSLKGNTAQGGTKTVVLETGARVATPLFISPGDVIRVNTQTGEYVERITKSG